MIRGFDHPSSEHAEHCDTCHCWGYVDNPEYDPDDTLSLAFPLAICPEKDCPHRP